MNKTLIAAAVSAAVAAPVASADITVYGRINNAIDLKDLSSKANSEATTDISTVASRFGLKGSTDLGNGLTVHGQYELDTVSDRESSGKDGNGPGDVRIATAGVSGSFGRLDVGNQWSAYNKTVGALISPTFTLGYYLYADVGGGLFRASNTIQYSNSWGPVGAVLDIRLNDANEGADVAEGVRGDGWGLGVTYQVTPSITLAAAYDTEDREFADDFTNGVFAANTTAGDNVLATFAKAKATNATATANAVPLPTVSADETRFGIAGTWNIGAGYWLNAGWQTMEVDRATLTNAGVAGVIDADDDGNATTTNVATTANLFNPDATAVFDETAVNAVTFESPEDVDTYFIYGGGPIGQKTTWLLGYAKGDNGLDQGVLRRTNPAGTTAQVDFVSSEATDDANQLVWGLYHNVGGGLRFYYEAISLENENKSQDGERHLLGIRVDF